MTEPCGRPTEVRGFLLLAEIHSTTPDLAMGDCGDMYLTNNAGTSKASQAFWQVDDVEAEVSELKARSVVFEEYDMPDQDGEQHRDRRRCETAWFKDSEGNILAVSQRISA